MPDKQLNKVIANRYVITQQIARGGMATVYKAIDKTLDRVIAIKIMHPHLTDNKKFLERFSREAKAAANLLDPGIIAVYDQGKTIDGSYYIVMEYVKGPTLRNLLNNNGPMPIKNAIMLILQISKSLAIAHKSGFIHRDIKPENIIITHNGKAKIADFGLARATDEHTVASSGVVLGTVAYLAPELVADGVSSTSTDVYAIGVLFYELITGKQPYEGENSIQIAYKHVHNNFPHVQDVDSNIPKFIDDFIEKLTNKDVNIRPKNAQVVYNELSNLEQSYFNNAKNDVSIKNSNDYNTHGIKSESKIKNAKDNKKTDDNTDQDKTAVIQTLNGNNAPSQNTLHLKKNNIKNIPKRNKKKKIFYILIPVIIIILAFASYFAYDFLTLVKVPYVANGGVENAKQILQKAHLNWAIKYQNSDTIQKGNIINTLPSTEVKVKKNSTVNIMVSSGIKYITITDYKEMDYSTYTNALKTQGYNGDIVTENTYSTTIKKGLIIKTDKKIGSEIRHDDTIILTVSKGAKPFTMIDIKGKKLADATTLLKNVNITITVLSTQFSDTVPQNQIISQSVASGTKTHEGISVNVTVSKGPKMVIVPNVVGKGYGAAKDILEAAGFKVSKSIIGSGSLGLVQSTNPPAASKIKNGSTITLNVV
jgi:serine/threonine-protein kinase